jgi:hypothetical protein
VTSVDTLLLSGTNFRDVSLLRCTQPKRQARKVAQ